MYISIDAQGNYEITLPSGESLAIGVIGEHDEIRYAHTGDTHTVTINHKPVAVYVGELEADELRVYHRTRLTQNSWESTAGW